MYFEKSVKPIEPAGSPSRPWSSAPVPFSTSFWPLELYLGNFSELGCDVEPTSVDLEDVEPTLVDLDDWSDNSLESIISLICRRGGRLDSSNRGK